MIFVVENYNTSKDSTLLGIDGTTGQERMRVPIPISTTEYYDTGCGVHVSQNFESPAGSPMVGPDGSVFMEANVYQFLNAGYTCPTNDWDNVLLLQISPDGTPSWSAPLNIGATESYYPVIEVGEAGSAVRRLCGPRVATPSPKLGSGGQGSGGPGGSSLRLAKVRLSNLPVSSSTDENLTPACSLVFQTTLQGSTNSLPSHSVFSSHDWPVSGSGEPCKLAPEMERLTTVTRVIAAVPGFERWPRNSLT